MPENTHTEPPRLDFSVMTDAVGDDHTALLEIMDLFLETAQELVTPLVTAVTTHDREQAAHGAHALLGAAGSIGGLRLAARARALEQAARDPEGGNLVDLFQATTAELQELVMELRERVSGTEGSSRA